jgi:hypothetical protein
MNRITFTTNWNKKLDCSAFTTIRLEDQIYQKGKNFEVFEKGHLKGVFCIVHLSVFKLNQLSEAMAYLDTGYNKEKTTNIIKKIYDKRAPDWDKQNLYYMVLAKVT